MSKSKQAFVSTCCALALVANSAAVFAQDRAQARTPQPPVERGGLIESNINGQATTYMRVAEPGQVATLTGGQGGGTPGFIASETGSNKVVKGAPYSAEVINEFTQVLADGNRITRRTSANVYRDSQGRTRSEQRVTPIGMSEWVNNFPTTSATTVITDPVEGVTYVLDKNERVARRSRFVAPPAPPVAVARTGNPASAGTSSPSVTAPTEVQKQIKVSGGVLQGGAIQRVQPAYPPAAKEARVSGVVQVQITVNEKGEVIEATVISGHPLLRDATLAAARQWRFKPTELGGVPVKVQGILTFNFTLQDGPAPATTQPSAYAGPLPLRVQYNREALGKQMIEGIECEGTKMVQIIPPGQIGNERAIEIVLETWYSPELQLTVLGKQNDPRFGETVFRLAGIVRVEPDEYLFKVPGEYSIKDDPVGYRVMEERIRREQ